jgi:hypothetical protein
MRVTLPIHTINSMKSLILELREDAQQSETFDPEISSYLFDELLFSVDALLVHAGVKANPAVAPTIERLLASPSRRQYQGWRTSLGTQVVRLSDGFPHELPLRLDLRNHSPTGFDWGYGGSGPMQLSLALCADYIGNDQVALAVYEMVKTNLIARLPQDETWLMGSREIIPVLRHILDTHDFHHLDDPRLCDVRYAIADCANLVSDLYGSPSSEHPHASQINQLKAHIQMVQHDVERISP